MTRKYTAIVIALLLPATIEAQKFYSDDPLLRDDGLVDVSEKPAEIELSDLYDRLGHVFKDWGASPIGSEASNVNTLDELPDNNWFTNRHERERMSVAELVRGPNRGEGPNPNETWTIFRGKSQGLTPGFQIYDEKGERYVIKLDPVEVPELASAAEIIATKIYYALGYNVPENYIVRVHPDRFAIEPGTEVEDRFGDKMPLTPFRFHRMIRRVPRLEDGTMRVTASKYIPGVPLGPFRYYETRSDDPNDIVAHEDRRELRGLRLIAAWTNHDDTRAHNTQDTWVEENGRHVLKHFLMDFGSTFGSGSVDMQLAALSFQYSMDFNEMKQNLVGFGFRVPEYRKAKWPDFPAYQAVGRFEAELFDPVGWRNDYPNPAFVRMTARDAFWAAKLLMSFTREELGAIVETGEYSRPEDAAYFLETLVERQRKCGRFGINLMNPLDEFRIDGGALVFSNLSERYGFVSATTEYRARWFTFDNDNGRSKPLGASLSSTETRLSLPASAGSAAFLLAEINSLNDEHPDWEKPVRIYLRRLGASYALVGIERASPDRATFPME